MPPGSIVTLAHPWLAAAGIGLATTPILVHLLTRPRPLPLEFSAMRFLEEVERSRRKRSRLRDALVLACRVTAILALALAIGRLEPARPAAAGEDAWIDRVVVLDVSRSMAARSGTLAAIDRARAAASRHLSARPGLRAGLVLAGAFARPVFDALSDNIGALARELPQVRVRPEALDAQAALGVAAHMLSNGRPGARREVVIASDFQRSSWAQVPGQALPEGTAIVLEPVAPERTAGNLAVTSIARPAGRRGGAKERLAVEVANFSDAARTVGLDVRVGENLYHPSVTVPPWGRGAATIELVLGTVGWIEGTASIALAQDALPDDDRRSFLLSVQAVPTAVIVTRDNPRRPGTGSYYLQRALAPLSGPAGGSVGAMSAAGASAESGAAVQIVRVGPEEARAEALSGCDVIVVAGAGPMEAPRIRDLASLAVRGKGILYVAQDSADASNIGQLAAQLGDAATLPVALTPAPASRRRAASTLGWLDDRQPPLACVAAALRARARELTCARALDSAPEPAGLVEDVLARYTDETAALVLTRVGAGRLCVLNMDLGGSALSRSPLFVPIVQELLLLLSGDATGPASEYPVGAPLTLPLPAQAGAAEGLALIAPDGTPARDVSILEDRRGALLAGRPEQAGIYRVLRRDTCVYAVAAECPPDESDLRTLDPVALAQRLGAGGGVRVAGPGSDEDDPARSTIWRYFVLLAILAALAELLVLKGFRT